MEKLQKNMKNPLQAFPDVQKRIEERRHTGKYVFGMLFNSFNEPMSRLGFTVNLDTEFV